MAITAGVEVGRAMAGFAADSVSAAGDFEAAVNGLSAVAGDALGAAGFSLEDVREKALQLGEDTKYSASEALAALTELTKGGVPIADVMGDATDATLSLASAAGLDLANAAEIVAKQLGVWADQGVNATAAADALSQAANASSTTVEELALGMANVGASAKIAGVSFEETVQTLALIAPGFSSASDAGTSFKTLLGRLIPTTDKQTEAMVNLGLATEDGKSMFFDASGSFIGMAKAADLLAGATDGLSEEQRLLALNTIFGQDAVRAAALLAEKGAEGFGAMGDAMDQAGTAAGAAAQMNRGWNATMDAVLGSVDTLKIRIGDGLLPVLSPLLSKLGELINIAGKFAAGGPFSFEGLTGLGIFLSENVNPALGKFVTNLALATDPMKDLKAAVLGFLGDVAAQLPGKLAEWSAKLGQWVLDALPGLGANLATLYQTLLLKIGEALPGIMASLAVWGQKFTDWVIAALPVLLTELGTFVAGMLQFLIDHAPEILSTLGQWTTQFLTWAITTGAKLIYEMGVQFGKFLGWLIEVVPKIDAAMKEWQQSMVRWILESWPGWMRELGALWSKFTGWISEQAGKLSADGSLGSALVAGIKKGIDDALSGLIAAARSAVQAAISAARSVMPGGGGGGAGGRAGGGFAMGGPLHGGGPYLVGEHGPELFVPASAGGIVPAGATAGIVNRTTNNYFNQTVHSNASASTVASDFAMMRAIAGAS